VSRPENHDGVDPAFAEFQAKKIRNQIGHGIFDALGK